MSHYKHNKRRKGGIKGCCWLCAMGIRHGGLRNKRIRTKQEKISKLREDEQKRE